MSKVYQVFCGKAAGVKVVDGNGVAPKAHWKPIHYNEGDPTLANNVPPTELVGTGYDNQTGRAPGEQGV
jgi:hypothetical protein